MARAGTNQRIVQCMGSSFYISLPRTWCSFRNVKKGDAVKLTLNDKYDLIISVGEQK